MEVETIKSENDFEVRRSMLLYQLLKGGCDD